MISGIQMAEMQSILKRKAEKLDDLIIAYSTGKHFIRSTEFDENLSQ